jgi:hypothetical protein
LKGIQKAVRKIFDVDRSGRVTVIDLMHVQAIVQKDTQFGKEIYSLVEEYSRVLMESSSYGSKFDIVNYLFTEFIPIS